MKHNLHSIFSHALTHNASVLLPEAPLATAVAAENRAARTGENEDAATSSYKARLGLLCRIADASGGPSDALKILQYALSETCSTLGYQVGAALLSVGREGDNRLESCQIGYVSEIGDYASFLEASYNITAWPGLNIPGRLLVDPACRWIESIANIGDFSRGQLAAEANLKSAIIVPIVADDELFGGFEFFSTTDVAPDRELLELLRQIGMQIGRVFSRQRSQSQLRDHALRDPLTGLSNRSMFEEDLRKRFDTRKLAGEAAPSLIMIDLDGFKFVNDTLGHRVGDAVLQDVATRLSLLTDEMGAIGRMLLGRTDIVSLSRMGGDEFMILVDGPNSTALSAEIAQAVHEGLRAPHRHEDLQTPVTASIGIVNDDGHYEFADELVRDADIAVGQARLAGPGRTFVFNQDMRASAVEALRIEADLRRAIDNHEFELLFQPILSLPSREIAGFEALLRWRRGPDELVSPEHFIQIAEDRGLIPVIGQWVLRKACMTIASINERSAGKPSLFVSVNVSPRQFLQANFPEQVREVLADSRIDPASLILEVTESAAITNPAQTARILQQLRGWNVRINLDDFGTGYSSLSHLQSLPFDGIKIDKSFIMNQTEEKSTWSIVNAILQLGRAMDLKVVAEGIETEFQYTQLAAMGCEFGQGYLFSKPVSEAQARLMMD